MFERDYACDGGEHAEGQAAKRCQPRSIGDFRCGIEFRLRLDKEPANEFVHLVVLLERFAEQGEYHHCCLVVDERHGNALCACEQRAEKHDDCGKAEVAGCHNEKIDDKRV